jgi:hypothetical protein
MTTVPLNIRPKDLQKITGLSYSRCAVIIRNIRHKYSKKKYQFLTIEETAEYLSIPASKLTENFKNTEEI